MSHPMERLPLLPPTTSTTSTPCQKASWTTGTLFFFAAALWPAYNTWKSWTGGQKVNNIATSLEAVALASCICIYCARKTYNSFQTRKVDVLPRLNEEAAKAQALILDRILSRLNSIIDPSKVEDERPVNIATLNLIEEQIELLRTLLTTTGKDRDSYRAGLEKLVRDFDTLKDQYEKLNRQNVLASPSPAASPIPKESPQQAAPSPADLAKLQQNLLDEFSLQVVAARINLSDLSASSTPNATPKGTPQKLALPPVSPQSTPAPKQGTRVAFNLNGDQSPAAALPPGDENV